jgi:hydrogenase expression/formation protein HypC
MCLAVPGRVIAIDGEAEFRSARVDFGGVTREACLAFVPEATVGDYVLVHVGFAIARVDDDAAQQALATLRSIDVLGPAAGAGSAGPLPSFDGTQDRDGSLGPSKSDRLLEREDDAAP